MGFSKKSTYKICVVFDKQTGAEVERIAVYLERYNHKKARILAVPLRHANALEAEYETGL